MKVKQASAMLFAWMLVMLLPLHAAGKSWAGEDFTIEEPENVYTFTADTPFDDPTWTLAGVTDIAGTLKLFQSSDNKGMNAQVYFLGKNKVPNLIVTRKSSDEAWSIYNFADISEEEQENFLAKLSQEPDGYTITAEIIREGEIPLISLRFDSNENFQDPSGTGITEIHEQVYATVFNGTMLTLNTQAENRAFSEEELAMARKTALSLKITKIISKEEAQAASQMSPEEIRSTLMLFAVFILLIIGSVIFVKIRSSKEKRRKKELADRLSAYRHENPSGVENTGDLLFGNITDCSNEVLHKFSLYHAYVKNLPEMLMGIMLGVALILLTVFGKAEWWMIAGAVALGGYQGFKIITAGSTVEKIQRKVYGDDSKRKARYSFYENVFRVGGVQSAMAYPYFQIIEARVQDNLVYLYYGPDNAYIVDINGFAPGKREAFLTFIKEKTTKA